MAHTVTGIDLGASAVKFVLVDVGFRASHVVSAFEEPVPAGDAPLAERQGEALQAGLARLPSESIPYLAAPGEMLAVRVIDLPFSDARKIEQVVGYELEGQIVHALQDVVFDHVVLKPSAGAGSSVLAVAGRTDELGDFLASLGIRGVEPRSLFAAPVVYQSLFSRVQPVVEPGCRLLIDLGQRRTNLCFLLRGETVFARTITRGGDALTTALATSFGVTYEEAERFKCEQGVLPSAAIQPSGENAQRMAPVLTEAMVPLMRELRQTIASFRARDKTPIETVLLTGGGADLAGIGEYLEEELTLPVAMYVPETGGQTADPIEVTVSEARYTLAAAIAWAGARGSKEIDLRRGTLQYKPSFSVVRQRARHLAALGAALLLCATVDGTMAMARLNKQKDQLQVQLKTATQELFGEPRMDAKAVSTLLKKGFREDMAPIPKATAFDLLGEISRRMPGSDKIKLDITELDIRPKKTTIRGTVDSAAAVDEMVGRLREIECYSGEEISKGPITEVSGGAKQFLLNINSKCP
jgi:general secretion pathway protein L